MKAVFWYAPPEPGDIVQCRFPQDQFPEPGPKDRPALVIRVDEFEEKIQIQADVTVAYGSSVIALLRAGQFILSHNEKQAGLERDTRFDLANQCTLPYNDIWFCPPPRSASTLRQTDQAQPKRGRLPLEIPAIKKAFAAAWRAATEPVNLTRPIPNLGRKNRFGLSLKF